jgi:hypothetical protein
MFNKSILRFCFLLVSVVAAVQVSDTTMPGSIPTAGFLKIISITCIRAISRSGVILCTEDAAARRPSSDFANTNIFSIYLLK